LPGQGDLDQPDADDRGHHAHRLFRAVQVGALFDMRLDEAGEARGIQEVARHQIGHPCPALGIGSAIRGGQKVGLGQAAPAGPDGRAGGDAEAPLFVLEADDRDRGAAGLFRRAGDL
jgi:hypothetical protein